MASASELRVLGWMVEPASELWGLKCLVDVSIKLGELWLGGKEVQGLEAEVLGSLMTPGKKTASKIQGEDD